MLQSKTWQGFGMTETHLDEPRAGSVLAAVSNALVSLHKEQFGRGPTGGPRAFRRP